MHFGKDNSERSMRREKKTMQAFKHIVPSNHTVTLNLPKLFGVYAGVISVKTRFHVLLIVFAMAAFRSASKSIGWPNSTTPACVHA